MVRVQEEYRTDEHTERAAAEREKNVATMWKKMESVCVCVCKRQKMNEEKMKKKNVKNQTYNKVKIYCSVKCFR